METNQKLMSNGELMDKPILYRSLMRKLIYLTITWQDISYAVKSVSQFMTTQQVSHLNVIIQILKYSSCGLLYQSSRHLPIKEYTNSNWVG